jgi:hypothetical protein
MDRAKVVAEAVFSVDKEEIEKREKYSYPVRLKEAKDCKPKQLENAAAGFAAGCAIEDIVVLADTTFFGKGTKGYLFAKDAFYGDNSTFTTSGFGKSCVPYPLLYEELEDVYLDEEDSTYLVLCYKNGEKKRVFGNISSIFLVASLRAVLKVLEHEQAMEEKKTKELQTLEEQMEAQNMSQTVKERVLLLYPELKQYQYFSRSDIVETIDVSASTAGDLIKKMKEAEIIEAVIGYGKGKYKFNKF